jgi:hypothetical protein
MKDPTMTDIKRAARIAAEKIVDPWVDRHKDTCAYENLVADIASALTSHARPAAGKWRNSSGEDFEACSEYTSDATGYVTVVFEPTTPAAAQAERGEG